MQAIFNGLFKLVLLAAGLVFVASLLFLAFLFLLLWALRALWARLTGQPVAAEAEVYAMAMLFIELMVWLALRWEEDMHQPRGNRWLILISLITGLSFGVHFMALLTIPSIGFIYYFKNFKKVTVKSFIVANIIIVAILLFIFKLLLPYTLAFFGKTEIFMVNNLGLPFNSGTIFALLIIVAVFYFGLKYTQTKNHPFYNTILLCVLFVLLGFSTWLMLPIRANANTPMNEHKPSDAIDVPGGDLHGVFKSGFGAGLCF